MDNIQAMGLCMEKGYTNLQYLRDFLVETFGAICFYNDTEDGFCEFSVDSNKKMETLAVYFPSRLDLDSQVVKSRLEKVAGAEFYKRYKGSSIRLPKISGNYIFSSFSYNDIMIGIYASSSYVRLGGGISYVVDYFLGSLRRETIIDYNNYRKATKTNNDFYIQIGINVASYIENYLNEKGLPLVTEKNGFFNTNGHISFPLHCKSAEDYSNCKNIFLNELENIENIYVKRESDWKIALTLLSKKDWEEHKEELGINLISNCKSSKFDD